VLILYMYQQRLRVGDQRSFFYFSSASPRCLVVRGGENHSTRGEWDLIFASLMELPFFFPREALHTLYKHSRKTHIPGWL